MPVHRSRKKKKTRRNVPIRWTISINALPSELLVHIFHIVKFSYLKLFFDWDWDERMDLTWVRVSQVCHRWRELALGSPTLWSNIELTQPEAAIEMLSRSQSAPLRLHTRKLSSSSFKARKHVWLVAEPQLSRVRELDLPGIAKKELEFLTKNIDTPLSLLETLRIHDSSGRASVPLIKLFQREMPALRTIDLNGCFLPRPLPHLPRLVSITLYSSHDGPCVWTVLETLESLEAMPSLEYAELVNIISPIQPGDTAYFERLQQKKVDLANLKSLRIYDVHLDTPFIVHALRYPSTALISLKGSWTSVATEASFQCILDICSRPKADEEWMTFLTIHLYEDSVSVFVKDEEVDETLCVTIYNLNNHPWVGPEDILKRLCKALPPFVDSLTMRSERCPTQWSELLAIFPTLGTVALQTSPSAYPAFISGLDGVVPNLETLVFEGRSIDTHPTFVPLLLDFLRKREDAEAPLDSIFLEEQWKPKESTIEQLREFTLVYFTDSGSISLLMPW